MGTRTLAIIATVGAIVVALLVVESVRLNKAPPPPITAPPAPAS